MAKSLEIDAHFDTVGLIFLRAHNARDITLRIAGGIEGISAFICHADGLYAKML